MEPTKFTIFPSKKLIRVIKMHWLFLEMKDSTMVQATKNIFRGEGLPVGCLCLYRKSCYMYYDSIYTGFD